MGLCWLVLTGEGPGIDFYYGYQNVVEEKRRLAPATATRKKEKKRYDLGHQKKRLPDLRKCSKRKGGSMPSDLHSKERKKKGGGHPLLGSSVRSWGENTRGKKKTSISSTIRASGKGGGESTGWLSHVSLVKKKKTPPHSPMLGKNEGRKKKRGRQPA